MVEYSTNMNSSAAPLSDTCNAEQCALLLNSKWQIIHMIISVIVPLSISILSYMSVKPITEDSELQQCSKSGDLKRSIKSFNWSCVVASALSMLISAGIEIHAYFMKKRNIAGIITLEQIGLGRKRASQVSFVLKTCIFTAIIVSASTAFATYMICKNEAKKKNEKKTTP